MDKRQSRIFKLSNDGRPDLALQMLKEPINKKLDYKRNQEALCYERMGNSQKALNLTLEAAVLPPEKIEDLILIYNAATFCLDLGDIENAGKYLRYFIGNKKLLFQGAANKRTKDNLRHFEEMLELSRARFQYLINDDQKSMNHYIERLAAAANSKVNQFVVDFYRASYEWKYASKEKAEMLYQGIADSDTTHWSKEAASENLERMRQGLQPAPLILKTSTDPFDCPNCGSTEYEWNDETFTRRCSYCHTVELPDDERKEQLDNKVLTILKEAEAIEFDTVTLNTSGEPTTLYSSKLGGPAYWEKGREFPRSADGHPLRLLAQLNFSELPAFDDEDFPTQGILQFFIDPLDDLYGADFSAPTVQSGFRVIYTENPVYDEAQIEHNIPFIEGNVPFPVTGVLKLRGTREKMCHTASERDFWDSLVLPIYNRVFNAQVDNYAHIPKNVQTRIEENFYKLDDKGDESFNQSGNRLGGKPFFTQGDPRTDEYDVLLLQIDSDFEQVMWGDSGIANFFISREKLKSLDFSDVLYNWDCY